VDVLALDMPREERIARWRSLMDGVERENVHWWMKKFVKVLEGDQTAVADPVTPYT
jgi:trehalose 6-phosphate synthase